MCVVVRWSRWYSEDNISEVGCDSRMPACSPKLMDRESQAVNPEDQPAHSSTMNDEPTDGTDSSEVVMGTTEQSLYEMLLLEFEMIIKEVTEGVDTSLSATECPAGRTTSLTEGSSSTERNATLDYSQVAPVSVTEHNLPYNDIEFELFIKSNSEDRENLASYRAAPEVEQESCPSEGATSSRQESPSAATEKYESISDIKSFELCITSASESADDVLSRHAAETTSENSAALGVSMAEENLPQRQNVIRLALKHSAICYVDKKGKVSRFKPYLFSGGLELQHERSKP